MELRPFDPANYIKTPEDLRYFLEALADPFDPEHYARSIESAVLAFENLRNAALEEAAQEADKWFPADTASRYPTGGISAAIRAMKTT